MTGLSIKACVLCFIVLLILVLMATPIIRFVRVGWEAKRKEIMDSFDLGSRLAYFEMFLQSRPVPAEHQAMQEFEALYNRWYGRRYFIFPAVVLFAVVASEAALVILTVLDERGYLANPVFNLGVTAIAGIAGAYMWVVNDFIVRARRLDLSPADLLWGALRLGIAVPMGYAFAALAAPAVGLFIAFGLGAFPLTALQSMLRRITHRYLRSEQDRQVSKDNVMQLQGIDAEIAERLFREDITSIPQVAYSDPIQLVMRSNLTLDFVLSCKNQAIAWLYLENRLEKVRPLGLRGAVEVLSLLLSFENAEDRRHQEVTNAFPLIARAINQTPTTAYVLFTEIAFDPHTAFIARVWARRNIFVENTLNPALPKGRPLRLQADQPLPAEPAAAPENPNPPANESARELPARLEPVAGEPIRLRVDAHPGSEPAEGGAPDGETPAQVAASRQASLGPQRSRRRPTATQP